jgi:hypothetical protein
MHGRRDSSSTIWRTVVFAGAMLGVPACGGPAKPAPVTPENTAPVTTPPPATDPATTTPSTAEGKPNTAPATPPTGDPCNGVIVPPQTAQPNPAPAIDEPDVTPPPKGKRPRGGGDRPTGRGFVLA